MKLEFIWFFFSFFIILFSFFSVTSGNPVFGVLFLVLSFLSSALFLISLGIDFIGLMLMVVYVGAIAVLFLFVVMMLNVNEEFKDFPLFIFVSIFSLLFYIYLNVNFCPLGSFFSYTDWLHIDKIDCLSCVGYVLYSDLIINFIEISIVLMIAMVGAIALNFTSEKGMRDQEFLFQSSRSTEIALFVK
jgi:NADH-quinone oxidoreductase subunit J|tara:strand:- start:1 stop:564 length:564 start_codon:yes stop_codon:yes gene_type:complete